MKANTLKKIPHVCGEQLLGKTEQHLCHLYDNVFIHQEMKKDFESLVASAHSDGIDIKVASGFRSFDRQLLIWNNKFSGKASIKDAAGKIINPELLTPLELIHSILLYSALPGASRHHWGCDIDVYAPNLLADGYQLQLEPWEYQEQGPLEKLSTWLNNHAHKFGFYFPYAIFQGGVAHEPWHLSYLPLAKQYQHCFDLQQLSKTLMASDLLGKEIIINNLDDIAKRYINNVCSVPSNVIITNTC